MGNTAAAKKGESDNGKYINIIIIINVYTICYIYVVKAFLEQAKSDFTKRWEEPSQVFHN